LITLFGRLRSRRVVARRAFGGIDACGRQPLDVRVVADRADDERTLLLARKFIAGGKPALETMAVHATEFENDHWAKTAGTGGQLTAAFP